MPARDLIVSAFRRLAEKCRTVHTSLDMVETVGELGEVEEREGGEEDGEMGEEEEEQPEELVEEEMVDGDGRDADSEQDEDA